MDQGQSRGRLPARRSHTPLTGRERWPVERETVGIVANTRPINYVAVPIAQPLTRLQRLSAWRKTHYVGDQLIRVGLILVGALFVVALALLALVLLGSWVAGKLPPASGLLGAAAVAVIVLSILKLAGSGSSSHGGDFSGHGFHWGRCDHK